MLRYKTPITYLIAYFFAIGTNLRYLPFMLDHPNKWMILSLIAGFFLLMALEPSISRRSQRYTHFYLATQLIILVAITQTTTIEDYLAIPIMSLILQAMHVLNPNVGFRWIGVFATTMAVSTMYYGHIAHDIHWDVSLPNVLIYTTAYLLTGLYFTIIHQVEVASEKSQKLLVELQDTHQKLQAYTTQAESLAVTQERNRLARELHDSVTQSLYSLTLFSEAARHMAEVKGYKSIEQQIKQIGVIGLQALKEMRLLVYELQPPELEKDGLVRALRRRLEAVEGRAGVEARLAVEEFIKLPGSVEQELFRIAQEALNNSLKHATADSVIVYLRRENGRIEMEIVDNGIGFEPETILNRGGMGLKNIRERAERLGAKVIVHSKPGEGTCIKVITKDIDDIKK